MLLGIEYWENVDQEYEGFENGTREAQIIGFWKAEGESYTRTRAPRKKKNLVRGLQKNTGS